MKPKTFGDHIRELRGARDLTLKEFGDKLDSATAPFLSDIELGRRYPSPDLLEKMARVLLTSVADLKSYDTRPPIQELKKKNDENPQYGLAFRKLVESNISAEDLMIFIKNNTKRPK
ncbi:MAG: helix-turn-helix domain-containing protein [Elusimicrobia bacterium]|nr:helix-turn-helix domain-containing protein [Elusimicrobiota bacterium]